MIKFFSTSLQNFNEKPGSSLSISLSKNFLKILKKFRNETNTNPRSAINISINTQHTPPFVPNPWRGWRARAESQRQKREWWGGTPVNRYKISSAIFPGKFSAAIVKAGSAAAARVYREIDLRNARPGTGRAFVGVATSVAAGFPLPAMKRTIRAHSGHRRRRRRLLRGGGKRARAGRRGGRDDPSALSAYHRVFVGLVRYATAWSETTRRTRFETSFAKRPPPGWIPRREGRERREGGERATVNYPSATSPN